jgi:hypothetical protein
MKAFARAIRAVLLLLFPVLAFAAPKPGSHPYARFYWDAPSSPHTSFGSCIDPVSIGNSSQCSELAVIFHDSRDGYLLFPGEDWTLLGVGYSVSGTGFRPIIGPSANFAPASWALLDKIISSLAPESSFYAAIHKLSSRPPDSITGAYGPAWRPPLYPSDKGDLRLFAGISWVFGPKSILSPLPPSPEVK